MPNIKRQNRLKFIEKLCEAMRQLILTHEAKLANLNQRLEKLEKPCQNETETATKQ
jgi:BMFP domain-containing protein YqiC